jgi:hypothetical protein
MKGKLLMVFQAGLVVGVVVTVVGWHPLAVAQKPEAAPRWEYKVTTFVATDDLATRQLNELAGDRWEYVGLVGTAKPNTSTVPGHEALVAFRRAKK